MKYDKALLNDIYSLRDDEKYMEASKVPLSWFNPFDKDKFNIINTEFKNDGHFYRFSPKELEIIKDLPNDLPMLARFSAGIQMMFVTNARIVKVRCKNVKDFPMNNMTFVGRAGFDTYFKESDEEEFKFSYSTFYPVFNKDSKTEWEDFLYAFYQNKERIILINFPLYNGVEQLEIGVEEGCYIKPYFYENKKRIICYGTSILEGASAPRPGICTTNYLSMKLRQEVLNYGFSGAAKLEKEIGEIIASRDNVEMFILDVEANAGFNDELATRFSNFLEIIYKYHPDIPIIVMNRLRINQDDEEFSFIKRMKEFGDKVLKDNVNEYQRLGKKIYFVDNYSLFKDASFTIDGLHPTSEGFKIINEAYLKAILKVKEELGL